MERNRLPELIIDEFSMVGGTMLNVLDQRLRQRNETSHDKPAFRGYKHNTCWRHISALLAPIADSALFALKQGS